MYRVYLDDHLLFDPTVEELVILDPQLDLQDNKSGGFDFTIPPTHPLYKSIEKHKSQITVKQDNRVLFKGRVLDDEADFQNYNSVICEGALSYFNDSVVRPYTHQGSVDDYVAFLVNQHNDQMGTYDHKKFKVGNITVSDPNDYIYRSSRVYPNTWEELEDKLLDSLGGHFVLRYEQDGTYIDYLADSDYISRQKIEFGENLLDIKRFTKGEDIATAIIPLGATISGEGEEERKLTIESVNNGKDYLHDETAVQLYGGYIFKTVEYQDVTLPQNLIQRGRAELAQAVRLGLTIELTAFDMSLLDINVDDFRVFEYVEVRSEPHDLSALFLVSKMTIHLTDPSRNKLTVGKNFNYLTTEQNATDKSVSQLKSSVIENESLNREIINDVSAINERTDNYWQVNNEAGGTPNMLAGNKNNEGFPNKKGSTIGGGGSNDYPNVVFADYATISGGDQNLVTNVYGTIGGGNSNSVHGDAGTVSGGDMNGVSGAYGIVSGGLENKVTADYSVVSGGQENNVNVNHGTISGGQGNVINGDHGVIGGGENNMVSSPHAGIFAGKDNQVTFSGATITGGFENKAHNKCSAIVNGERNTVNSPYGLIGNGLNNKANSNHSTVINGENNTANPQFSTVLNGKNNQANGQYASVLAGQSNMANGPYASVLAGQNNMANADASAVISGQNNMANYPNSTAMGRNATAGLEGSVAHANGNFDGGGSAQTQRAKFIRQTTTNTKVILGINNTDESLRYNDDKLAVYNLDYVVMAQSASGKIKVWKLNVVIGNAGSGLAILSTPNKSLLVGTGTTENWDISFTVTGPDEWGLTEAHLEVEGSTEETYWMADLMMTELSLPDL
ncbi:phage tail spike protein [Jeotgalibaca porci]|uniref:phage tail spike protein n=1 Tax=Jeotgalibaca porci TaxID=1868793 RepID=UPI0035A17305